jgi:multiple sugar transport system substrate-binding protein
MIKKRSFVLIVFVLIGALLLAACQSEPEAVEVTRVVEVEGETVVEEVEVTRVVEVEAEEEPMEELSTCNVDAPEEYTVATVLAFRFPTNEFLAEEIKACGEVENLDVNSKLMGWGATLEQSTLALSGGGTAPYEIIATYNTPLVGYADKGWVLPLDEYVEKYWDEYDLGDYLPSVWDRMTYDGQIYCMPTAQNIQFFFYRSDIFEQYGLEPPETYDEWIAAAEALKDAPEIEYPVGLVFSSPSSTTEFDNAFRSFGGQWFDEDGRPTFNSPEGVQAVEFLLELLQYMPPAAPSFSNNDLMVALQQGQVAMGNIWLSRAAQMDDPETSTVVGLIDFAKSPSAEAGGIGHGSHTVDCMSIPANIGVDPEMAVQMILEATDKESMNRAASVAPLTRDSIATDPDIEAQYRYLPGAVANIKSGASGYPSLPYMQEVAGIVSDHLQRIWAGEVDAQTGLDEAADDVESFLIEQGYLE